MLYLQWPTYRNSYYGLSNGAIYNNLERPLPPVLRSRYSSAQYDEYLRNGTRYGHSFNRILIGTYICFTQQYHFE